MIFAAAAIPVFYALGKTLFNHRIGVIASFLLGVNGFFIFYSQEARAYSLLVFLTLCSSYFFVKSVIQPSRKTWVGYAVFSVLSVYSHFFAFWIILVHIVSLVFLPRDNIDWKGIIFSTALIFVCSIPLLVFISVRDIGQISWIYKPGLGNIKLLFFAFSGWAKAGLAFAYYLFSAVALIFFLKTRLGRRTSLQVWRESFPIIWFLFPIASTFAVSMIKPMFIDKYLIVSLPAFILCIAVGVSKLKNLWTVIAVTVILSGFSTKATLDTYEGQKKEEWREICELVLSLGKPDDALIFINPYSRVPFHYYRQKQPFRKMPGYVYPPNIPGTERGEWTSRVPKLNAALLRELALRHRRMWVVYAHHQWHSEDPQVGPWLAENFKQTKRWGGYVNDIEIVLYWN